MNILIVSQYYWPESFRINDVAKTLNEKGQYVDILTGKPNYPSGKIFEGYKAYGCLMETNEKVNIYRVPILPREMVNCV